MEWQVKYEPLTGPMPWGVYVLFDGNRVYKQGFQTEEEAREWVCKQEKSQAHPHAGKKKKADVIEEASIESFPASDPPAWTKTVAKSCSKDSQTKH